jgi:formylmethanofuran dehydrogenase subunit B
MERYSAEPTGLFVARGRADRYIAVLDREPTETSQNSDTFIRLTPDEDLDACNTLLQQVSSESQASEGITGTIPNELQPLAVKMKSCRYGALFVGTGQGGCDGASIEALVRLVAELNKFTRFTIHFMPKAGGLTGAENVLCWQTGFPFAVNFANGSPQYDPVAFSANHLLENGKVDTAVLVGSELTRDLSPEAQDVLGRLPTISLSSPIAELTISSIVQVTTAIYGIHAAGTAYRMDGVPVPLRRMLPSPYPTDEEALTEIASRLR